MDKPDEDVCARWQCGVDGWFRAWMEFLRTRFGLPKNPWDPPPSRDQARFSYGLAKRTLASATTQLAVLGDALGVDTSPLFRASGDLDGASDETLDDMWNTAKLIDARLQVRRSGIAPDSVSIVAENVKVQASTASVTGEVVRVAGPSPASKSERAKSLMSREQAEQKIAAYLEKRPNDTVQQVAESVGCSVGVVSESAPWRRLMEDRKARKRSARAPTGTALDERTISSAGGNPSRQRHEWRDQAEAVDAALDARDMEILSQIDEYRQGHPDASVHDIARAVGCTAREVDQRQAQLDRLTAEQARDAEEDDGLRNSESEGASRQRRVRKRI